MADHLPGRLWIRDRDLRYLYVNPQLAANLGHSEDELIGKAPEDLWEPGLAASSRALCERALRGEVVDITERWPDDTGGYFRSLLFAVQGEAEAALLGGLMFDITEQHEAQVELERHAERLRLTVEGAVLAMGNIVERRDPYTAGHERRVAELSVAIASRMGMPGGEVDGLRLAALIHDVGKISVPAEILSKPGRLSQNEFDLIKVHAQAGHDVLQSIAFERPVAEMVLQHHERLDGSGYPNGLRGDEILPEARVMAVADTYEAMISIARIARGCPRRRRSPSFAMEPASATTRGRSRPACGRSTTASSSRTCDAGPPAASCSGQRERPARRSRLGDAQLAEVVGVRRPPVVAAHVVDERSVVAGDAVRRRPRYSRERKTLTSEEYQSPAPFLTPVWSMKKRESLAIACPTMSPSAMP